MTDVLLGSRTLQPRRQLLAGGQRVPLGKRALDILSVLAEAGGKIVTKDELLSAVWPGIVVEENALQVHIVALRKALGPEAERLKTIRGVGYQLDVDPAPVGAPLRTVSSSGRLIALIAVAAFAALAGLWATLGSDLGLRPRERIPVVVRELTATSNGDPAEAALASGITDELIIRLRRIPELRVATADADGSVQGNGFSGAHVIDGNIRHSAGQLRVTSRLSNAEGEVLWSQTFDRPLADLFDLQEQLAASIADALSVSFDVGANAAAAGGTDNADAFAAYVQFYGSRLDPDPTRALQSLDRAIELDPHFAKALAYRAGMDGISASLVRSAAESRRLLARMDRDTRRSLADNPELGLARAARAVYFVSSKDYAEGDRQMRRLAESASAEDPAVRSLVANHYITMGRVREGVAIRDANIPVDPVYRNDPFRIWDLVMLGRLRDAAALYDKLDQLERPELRGMAYHAFWAHLLMDGEDKGLAFARREGVAGVEEELRAIGGDTTLPAMTLDEVRTWATHRYGDGNKFAVIQAALYAAYFGQRRLSLNLMRVAGERPGGNGTFNAFHPVMAEVRKMPEFGQLMIDLGLATAWRESGEWGDYCRPVSATEITCI